MAFVRLEQLKNRFHGDAASPADFADADIYVSVPKRAKTGGTDLLPLALDVLLVLLYAANLILAVHSFVRRLRAGSDN